MLCPICKTVSLAMTDRQGIEIDYCPDCRGVWLDRGELDRLIERAESPVAPPRTTTPPHHGQSYPHSPGHRHDGYRHGRKHHKSLLGELFDF